MDKNLLEVLKTGIDLPEGYVIAGSTTKLQLVFKPEKGDILKLKNGDIAMYEFGGFTGMFYSYTILRKGTDRLEMFSLSELELSEIYGLATQPEKDRFFSLLTEQGFSINDNKELVWKPQEGQTYYYIKFSMYPEVITGVWKNSDTDLENFNSSNYFYTKEECNRVVEDLKDRLWYHINNRRY